ncbi:hypothetical protein XFLAVUS301_27780 [Xanthobacter flavus]|uniref:Uncharacterized protein n=1 Tax=Xanthobacter flavus TaxID=281 RepID=A0A9W6CLU6_XANFL|nr:hypothetical protein XFLAVUS301_27780 [Xanthobacter flavus]
MTFFSSRLMGRGLAAAPAVVTLMEPIPPIASGSAAGGCRTQQVLRERVFSAQAHSAVRTRECDGSQGVPPVDPLGSASLLARGYPAGLGAHGAPSGIMAKVW